MSAREAPAHDGSEAAGGALVTFEALGFRAHGTTMKGFVEAASTAIATRSPLSLFYLNFHSLYLYYNDAELRRAFEPATAMIDGMPIVLLLRLAGQPAGREQRVTWVDFIWPLLEAAQERGWRVFYLGSSEATCARALAQIRDRLPGICIESHHGYVDASFGSADSVRLVSEINAFNADLCLVGMGTPRQEYWIAAHGDLLQAPVVAACGACMEYVAGAVATPPRWMGRVGVEWAGRLLDDPRRFAYRYLVEPWLLLVCVAREAGRGARFPRLRRNVPHPISRPDPRTAAFVQGRSE